jgi:hypothetical protein
MPTAGGSGSNKAQKAVVNSTCCAERSDAATNSVAHSTHSTHAAMTAEKAKGKKDDDDDDEGSLAQKAKMKADADKVKASTCCAPPCFPMVLESNAASSLQLCPLLDLHAVQAQLKKK